MKKLIFKFQKVLIITLAHLLIITSIFAQAPQSMSYQAVVRDASNNLVKNQSIGMRVTIYQQNGPTPHVYYEETYSPNPQTNADGLVSIMIGGGTPVTGIFSAINWANGDTYQIKTEIDPTGGTNYTITGSSPLLSVPYALHANKADSVTYSNATPIKAGNNITITGSGTTASPYVINDSVPIISGNNIIITGSGKSGNPYVIKDSIHQIGDSYGGGIVFYVYDNGRHGLIAATADQSTGLVWTTNAYQSTVSNAVRNGVNGGQTNTERIIIQAGVGSYAAQLCANYNGGNFGDWYLPSIYELNLMYSNISNIGGFAKSDYWSSIEYNNNTALFLNFRFGSQSNGLKSIVMYVRAIRAF